MVKVSDERYRELIEAEVRLSALEQGGVDNWYWYGGSISDFKEAFIEENAKALMNKFGRLKDLYLGDIVDYLVEGVTEDGV